MTDFMHGTAQAMCVALILFLCEEYIMKRAITGSLALLFAAGIVSAQNASPPAGGAAAAAGASQGASGAVDFSALDTNKDGRLSSTEVQANTELRSAFATLDTDRDNSLSQSEFQKWDKAGKPAAAPASQGTAPQGSAPSSSPGRPSVEKADPAPESAAPRADEAK